MCINTVYKTLKTARRHVVTLVINEAVSLVLTLGAVLTGSKQGKVSGERGAPLQDGEDVDGTGCVLQYEHPPCSHRCSFVRLPADLNAALLLRHSEPIRSGNCTPGKNPRWRTGSALLRHSFRTADPWMAFPQLNFTLSCRV